MILQGYFDESERDGAGDPICVGGFVFKTSDYEKFQRRWRDVLRHGERKFRAFHMTDLYAGHGEYRGLSMSDRAAILARAVDAITAHSYSGVAILFHRDEFEQAAPEGWLNVYGSIYSAACQMVLQAASFYVRKDRRCHLPILYVFERGHKHRAEADAMLTAIGKSDRARREFQYKNHLFEEKHREHGLQAADLLVWTITKAQLGGQPRGLQPFKEPIWRLAQTLGESCHPLVFTGAKLQRFFNEQAYGEPTVIAEVGPRKRSFR